MARRVTKGLIRRCLIEEASIDRKGRIIIPVMVAHSYVGNLVILFGDMCTAKNGLEDIKREVNHDSRRS